MDCRLFHASGAQEEKAVLPNTVYVLGTLSSNNLANVGMVTAGGERDQTTEVKWEFTQKCFEDEHIHMYIFVHILWGPTYHLVQCANGG